VPQQEVSSAVTCMFGVPRGVGHSHKHHKCFSTLGGPGRHVAISFCALSLISLMPRLDTLLLFDPGDIPLCGPSLVGRALRMCLTHHCPGCAAHAGVTVDAVVCCMHPISYHSLQTCICVAVPCTWLAGCGLALVQAWACPSMAAGFELRLPRKLMLFVHCNRCTWCFICC
jgi:hypothetical protein